MPEVRGWCPSAYRPMMSGDGLVVRVKPCLGRLSRDQALGLCAAARRFGSGFLDATGRANLQIRGVAEADHLALIGDLSAHGIVADDPELERRRNVIVSPFWKTGDLTHRLAGELMERLGEAPDLPDKFGFVVDTGRAPLLGEASGDVRLERTETGVIVRADGLPMGRVVEEAEAVEFALELARWFAANRAPAQRRMAQVSAALGADWRQANARPSGAAVRPGAHAMGRVVGIPFGQVSAEALSDAAQGASGLRILTGRLMLVEDGLAFDHAGFVARADDPLLSADACPGMPFCLQASVETRDLARRVSPKFADLHVSGCAKGCARSKPAAVTLVGRDGKFDVIRNGTTGDKPIMRGIAPDSITAEMLDSL